MTRQVRCSQDKELGKKLKNIQKRSGPEKGPVQGPPSGCLQIVGIHTNAVFTPLDLGVIYTHIWVCFGYVSENTVLEIKKVTNQ